MKVIIDRFEGLFVVCEKENGQMSNIEKNKVPAEAKEGDVLLIEGGEIVMDVASTLERKKKIDELTKDLWQ